GHVSPEGNDATGVDGIDAVDCPGQLGAPGADDTGDAHDLARSYLQVDVVQHAAPSETFHLQQRFALTVRSEVAGVEGRQFSPHHHLNEFGHGRGADGSGTDHLPVT